MCRKSFEATTVSSILSGCLSKWLFILAVFQSIDATLFKLFSLPWTLLFSNEPQLVSPTRAAAQGHWTQVQRGARGVVVAEAEAEAEQQRRREASTRAQEHWDQVKSQAHVEHEQVPAPVGSNR